MKEFEQEKFANSKSQEGENNFLAPREAKELFYAFCDGEIETLEGEAAEIENWRAEVQSGTNKRRSHELKNLRLRINQIKSLKWYAGRLFDRIPNVKTEPKE